MTEILNKLTTLPPFFFIVVAILFLGIVFSILKRVAKLGISLIVIAMLVFVIVVLLQK